MTGPRQMSQQHKERDLPAENEVHVWQFPLQPAGATAAILSRDESERAQRFRFDRHRRRFSVRRSKLRSILSAYSGIDAGDIDYIEGPYGKPTLANVDFHFSTSHSHELGLVLISRHPTSGIDLEYLAHARDFLNLARTMFAADEYDAIRHEPDARQKQAFLNCWTAKEAYLKALGFGLSVPLESFCVATSPDRPPGLLWDRNREAVSWTFWRRQVEDDYVITLAVLHALESITLITPDAEYAVRTDASSAA